MLTQADSSAKLSAMKTKTLTIEKARKRIAEIKRELQELDELRPGKISQQYNICGNPTCGCKDAKNPRKHGPYFQLSYTWKGRSTSEFIKAENVVAEERRVLDYKRMRALTVEWVDLSLIVARMRKQEAREVERQAKEKVKPKRRTAKR